MCVAQTAKRRRKQARVDRRFKLKGKGVIRDAKPKADKTAKK